MAVFNSDGVVQWQDGILWKTEYKKNPGNLLKNVFLEHMSGYFRYSICGKNFSPIERTVFDI
jgi:hypothetical protein